MYCILIAGMPACGKSTFAEYLSKKMDLPMISKDSIKELMFDTVGFRSRAEKVNLGVAAMNILYYFAEAQMRCGQPFILENNFEDVSRQPLLNLLNKYGYSTLTVIFEGNMKAVYKRFIERDMSSARHRGHVVNTQYPEPEGEKAVYVPAPFEAFERTVESRGWKRFDVGGKVIKVNTTDYSKVDYERIAEQILLESQGMQ